MKKVAVKKPTQGRAKKNGERPMAETLSDPDFMKNAFGMWTKEEVLQDLITFNLLKPHDEERKRLFHRFLSAKKVARHFLLKGCVYRNKDFGKEEIMIGGRDRRPDIMINLVDDMIEIYRGKERDVGVPCFPNIIIEPVLEMKIPLTEVTTIQLEKHGAYPTFFIKTYRDQN